MLKMLFIHNIEIDWQPLSVSDFSPVFFVTKKTAISWIAIGIWWFAVIDTEILCFFREILSFRGHRRYWDTVLFLKILSPDPKRRSWDTEILCFADGERYWDTVILSFARERKIPRYWDTEFRQAEKDTEILRYWASPGWERYWDTNMLSFSKRKIPLSSGKTI